jgi:hypothetical protein
MTSEQRAVNSRALLPEKIASRHRERLAIVYLRQSTPQQLKRHQESTRLQYALADLAVDLGWQRERVIIVNDDLGLTGSTIECRLGFQRVMTEVGLCNVGIVLGIEVSRLARSCRDWHQLLEMCGLFDTLIADADGVYDPAYFNDRLLLGLKWCDVRSRTSCPQGADAGGASGESPTRRTRSSRADGVCAPRYWRDCN